MTWDGLNRRKFPRVNFPCLVITKFGENDQDVLLTHTENVGVGGVCIILKKQLKIFTQVRLEIDLLDVNKHIECEGKVVWSVRRKSKEARKPLFYDIGIEFVNLSAEDQQRMSGVVSSLVKKGFQTAYKQ